MNEVVYHKPVLLEEVLTYLDPQPGKTYVDVTFGGGGHTKAILLKEPKCKVVAIDWDKTALEKNGEQLQEMFPDRLTLLWGNFAQLYNILKKAKITSIDGILADFGTSQFQISNSEGLSVYKDSFLDMRMSKAHHKITAYEFINKASQRDLEDIFFKLGEERYSKQIVQEILEQRKIKKIGTTYELVELIKKAVPMSYRKGKIHPATRIFQALRIYVNDELQNIKSFLDASLKLLNINGKLVCISFHSLEDRIVKQYFKDHPGRNERGFEILTKRVVTATEEELKINPSSRSAKLRAAKICINDKF